MAPRRAVAALAAALVVCVPAAAYGDDAVGELPRPNTELASGDAVITTVGGVKFRVPQGSHILVPDAYSALDVEMRRLQERETRLAAENESMRKTTAEWQPGWKLLLSATIVGIATGVYVGLKF